MKTLNAKSFFKKVSAGKVNAGVKRPDLSWNFAGLEVSDIPSLDQDSITKVLNGFVENFGRKLIAQNGDNWEFVPDESIVNFNAAYADFTAERTSSRILTKETLAAFGKFYKEKVMELLGTSAVAAATGEAVICAKLANIAGKNDVLEVFAARISSLVELCSEDDLIPHADVIESLLKLIEELKAVSVSADML